MADDPKARAAKEAETIKAWEARMEKAQKMLEQDSRNCAFYMRTGCCRYGEACSKFHPYPETSPTLLFKNMYDGLGMVDPSDEDNDVDLQYTEDEIHTHFKKFWNDTVCEFEKFGEIRQLRICRNFSQHLRGNVYVTYKKEEDAKKATALHGRFYASKQLNAEYAPIEDWKRAICGLFLKGKCERGNNCNFLHVFHNPSGKYEGREEEERDDRRRDGRDSNNGRRDDRRRDDDRRGGRPDFRDRRRDDVDRRDRGDRGDRDRGDRGVDRGGDRGVDRGDRGVDRGGDRAPERNGDRRRDDNRRRDDFDDRRRGNDRRRDDNPREDRRKDDNQRRDRPNDDSKGEKRPNDDSKEKRLNDDSRGEKRPRNEEQTGNEKKRKVDEETK